MGSIIPYKTQPTRVFSLLIWAFKEVSEIRKGFHIFHAHPIGFIQETGQKKTLSHPKLVLKVSLKFSFYMSLRVYGNSYHHPLMKN